MDKVSFFFQKGQPVEHPTSSLLLLIRDFEYGAHTKQDEGKKKGFSHGAWND